MPLLGVNTFFWFNETHFTHTHHHGVLDCNQINSAIITTYSINSILAVLVVVKVWMLNGFWNEISKEAESLWSWVKLFAELDNHSKVPRGAKGSELDQVLAAKFLEQTEQTLTAKQRKEALREIDVNNDGKMALVEYLLYRFGMTADQVANAKQGKCFNFFKEYARKENRTPPATLFNLSHADICVHSHCALFFFCFIFKLAPTKGHAQELAACQAIINEAMAMLPEVQANLVAQRAAQIEHTAALAAVREAKVAAAHALTAQNLAEAELRTALESVRTILSHRQSIK